MPTVPGLRDLGRLSQDDGHLYLRPANWLTESDAQPLSSPNENQSRQLNIDGLLLPGADIAFVEFLDKEKKPNGGNESTDTPT